MRSTASPDNHARIGRRSVVRAGATAAWAVPVIAMAAPAQAATCSGGTSTLVAGTPTKPTNNKGTWTFAVVVTNTGKGATCALSATATASGSQLLETFTVGTWPGASGGKNGAHSLTVSAPATDQLAPNTPTTYVVSVKPHSSGNMTVTVTFNTSNGGTATVTVSLGGS